MAAVHFFIDPNGSKGLLILDYYENPSNVPSSLNRSNREGTSMAKKSALRIVLLTAAVAASTSGAVLASTAIGGASEGASPIKGTPVGVPSGPVQDVSACPSSPAWSQPLPAGVTVSPPSLATGGATAFDSGQSSVTYLTQGSCEYTVSAK